MKKLPKNYFEGLDWSFLMESIGEHLSHRFNSYSNGNGSKQSLPSIAIEQLSVEEQDKLIASYSDLIDPNYRLWFIKRLRAIGKQRFVEAGDKARKYGNNPQRLFSDLVK